MKTGVDIVTKSSVEGIKFLDWLRAADYVDLSQRCRSSHRHHKALGEIAVDNIAGIWLLGSDNQEFRFFRLYF